jgi:alpha-tubulin suppressor-like RCC1 family protein
METKPIDFLPSDVWKIISRHLSQKDRGVLRATSRFFFKHITPVWDQYVIDSRRARLFSSSDSHTIILTEAGELLGCGNNSMGQLGLPQVKTQPFLNKINDKTNIRAVATGNNHSLLLTEAGGLWVYRKRSIGL